MLAPVYTWVIIFERNMLRFALLACATLIPAIESKYGTYLDIFHIMLQTSLHRTLPGSNLEWQLDGYDVVGQKYPSDNRLAEYDAILISGSGVVWDTEILLLDLKIFLSLRQSCFGL